MSDAWSSCAVSASNDKNRRQINVNVMPFLQERLTNTSEINYAKTAVALSKISKKRSTDKTEPKHSKDSDVLILRERESECEKENDKDKPQTQGCKLSTSNLDIIDEQTNISQCGITGNISLRPAKYKYTGKKHRRDTNSPHQRCKSAGVESKILIITRQKKYSHKYNNRLNQAKYTQNELEYYLPRKSFFDCHDKTLKAAGYNVGNEANSRLHRRSLRSTTQIIRDEKDVPLHDDEYGDVLTAVASQTIETEKVECRQNDQRISSSSPDQTSDKHVLSSLPKQRSFRSQKKKFYEEEEEVIVDYTILLQYFKYISDNPNEYMSMKKSRSCSASDQNSTSIIKLGQIFSRGHNGIPTDSLLVHAAHDLRPRYCDPGTLAASNKERAQSQPFIVMQTKKDPSLPPKQESASHESGTVADELKTEFERIRAKVDKWIRTVSTAQLMKAKAMALKDLGHEDAGLSKWWESMSSFHYVRSPIRS